MDDRLRQEEEEEGKASTWTCSWKELDGRSVGGSQLILPYLTYLPSYVYIHPGGQVGKRRTSVSQSTSGR